MKEEQHIPTRNVRGKKTRNPGYEAGNHWVICDVCGCAIRAKDTRFRWDGAVVCMDDFDTRHPQDFVRGRKDKIYPDEPVRPEGDSSSECTLEDLSPSTLITIGTESGYTRSVTGYGPTNWYEVFAGTSTSDDNTAFGSVSDNVYGSAVWSGAYMTSSGNFVVSMTGNRAIDFWTSLTVGAETYLSASAFRTYRSGVDTTAWIFYGANNPYSGYSVGETVNYTLV